MKHEATFRYYLDTACVEEIDVAFLRPESWRVEVSAPSGARRDRPMDTGNTKPWEERLHEAGARAEEEVKRLVRYLDEEVVPDVRRHSSTALRAASERLAKLAQSLDDNKRDDNKPRGQE